jgi:UDP-N-acetylglucosamine 2-epimerase (non-hydrolysing)
MVAILVGTRPNFIKITQFKKEAKLVDLDVVIIHTGQHYDFKMAGSFFEQLEIEPDYFLDVKPGNPARQVGDIIVALSELLSELNPGVLVVPGDVNSTLAGAITANKMGIRLAHLESGLRSSDERMPEEINRILTDRITDLFFVTEQSGMDNLREDKVTDDRLHFVGNTMIDTLVGFDEQIKSNSIIADLNLSKGEYVLVTIHRPSNVDELEPLKFVLELITRIAEKDKVVFPIHPRTIQHLKKENLIHLLEDNENIVTSEPLDYFSFQNLILNSKVVLTDSGGIQEETTFRQVPCLTLRENTERPITISMGTNQLLPFDIDLILENISSIDQVNGDVPPLWDGKSTKRIVEILKSELSK